MPYSKRVLIFAISRRTTYGTSTPELIDDVTLAGSAMSGQLIARMPL